MPISEDQRNVVASRLDQQSAATYETVRKILNDSSSPYYAKDFKIFLQGSYGNDTNLRIDSDVDIAICLNWTFYSGLTFPSKKPEKWPRKSEQRYKWKLRV